MVQRIVGFLFLCASLFLIWQGYENSRLTPETLEMSRVAACDLFAGCSRGLPSKSKSDIIRRQYEWLTPQGPYTATCTRKMLFAGSWSCTAQRGELGIGGNY